MIKSSLFSILILFLCVLVQAGVLSNIYFLPSVPDLVLICSVYFALNNGCVFGQSMGFIGGLFIDFLSGATFGLNCFIRTIIGYTCGYFKKSININSFLVGLFIGFFATILKALLIYLCSFLFPNMINTYNFFSSIFIFEVIINSILTPIVFKFLRSFDDYLLLNEHK